MSRLSLVCPHCAREGKLPESVKTLPRRVKCPGCQKDFHPAAAGGDDFVVVPEGTDQLKETAKRAATAIGEGIMHSAKKAKVYAESDEARALKEKARRRAAEVGEKAKVAVTSLQEGGTRFLENPIVIGLSMLFCFPIGLFFVWRHSRWSKVAKSAWTGAFCVFLVLLLIRGSQIRQEAKAALSEADARWQAGDHAAAVAKYRSVLLMLNNYEKPLAYGRIIDFDMEGGNAGAARKLIEEALGRGIYPSVNSLEAKSLLAKIESEGTGLEQRQSSNTTIPNNSSQVSNDQAKSGEAEPVNRKEHVDNIKANTVTSLSPKQVMALIERFDTSDLDYSKGPHGEPLINREHRDEKTGLPLTQHGYIGEDGKFLRHGQQILWRKAKLGDDERRKSQEQYCFEGFLHGSHRAWSESGELRMEMTHRRQKAHGLRILYHKGGSIEAVTGYRDGRLHGPNFIWHENGKLASYETLVDGTLSGEAGNFFADGTMQKRMTYTNGMLSGTMMERLEGGKTVMTEWENGKIKFSPGLSNKRSFYYKAIEQSDMSDPDHTNLMYKKLANFIRIFGKPQRGTSEAAGYIDPFEFRSEDYASPRTWYYRCSDGVLQVKAMISPQSFDFHVLIDPGSTLQ